MSFWTSKHREWLVPASTVEESYRRHVERFAEAGKTVTADEVRMLHLYFCRLIHRLAKQLKLRQRAVSTAIVYYRRFYLRNSLLDTDPRLLVGCVLWLASKVEESPAAKHASVLLDRLKESLSPHVFLPYGVQDLYQLEYYLLQELEFHLVVHHPYRSLEPFIRSVGRNWPPEVSLHVKSCAWWVINDSYCTDLCLVHPPHLVALAALHFAAMAMEGSTSVKRSAQVSEWLAQLRVDLGTLETITSEMTRMYALWGAMEATLTSHGLPGALANIFAAVPLHPSVKATG